MGARQSTLSYKTAVPARAFAQAEADLEGDPNAPAIIEARKKKLRRVPNELTPTAAVVGSGLTGLLTARELASRGFDVTVIEQNHLVAQGASRHVLGAWSEHHPFQPSPTVRRFVRNLASGIGKAGEVVTWDTAPARVIDRVFGRFLFQRLRATRLPFGAVEPGLDEMKAENTRVMNQLLKDHPELAATVIARHTIDRPAKQNAIADSGDAAAAATVPDAVTVVDSPKFLDGLVEVLRREYGVNFITDRRLVNLQFKMAFDVESVAHANIKHTPYRAPDTGEVDTNAAHATDGPQTAVLPSDEYAPVMEGHAYDLYVLATGGNIMNNTFTPYVVPVVSFGGYSLDIPSTHPLAAAFKTPVGKAGMIQWAPVADPAGGSTPATRISGLLSLRDRVKRAVSPQWAYHNLLVQAQNTIASGQPGTSGELQIPGNVTDFGSEETLSGCTTGFYKRGFACDHLPVVTRIGMAENVFAVGGLGDDTFALAGGAASLLGKMLAREFPMDGSNPFTIWRFNSVRIANPPPPDELPWQYSWFAMEKWLLDFGGSTFAPFAAGAWGWYVELKNPATEDGSAEAQRERLEKVPLGPEAPWQRRMRLKELRKKEDEERRIALGGEPAASADKGSA
jgi:hypothetical protein